jgi:NTP pyrophosphatase (non-canonical NTP hydrolase)
MSFKAYQKEVDIWAQQYETPYWQPLEILARLSEEVGEVARELNHQFGPKKRKLSEDNGNLSVEIADALFTLICLANSQGIDLDTSFKEVMDKCYGRDKDRFALKNEKKS